MDKTPVKKPAGPANKGLRIVARKDLFRRCGRAFGAEPVVIPLTDVSAGEVEILKAEAQLVVVDVDIEPPKDAAPAEKGKK